MGIRGTICNNPRARSKKATKRAAFVGFYLLVYYESGRPPPRLACNVSLNAR
jgi:hypothetical protein